MRATFLLKLVILVISLGVFALVVLAAASGPMTALTLALLLVFWAVAIEMQVLPYLIERTVIGRVTGRTGKRRSLWLVNLDEQHREEIDRLRSETRDNPSVH